MRDIHVRVMYLSSNVPVLSPVESTTPDLHGSAAECAYRPLRIVIPGDTP